MAPRPKETRVQILPLPSMSCAISGKSHHLSGLLTCELYKVTFLREKLLGSLNVCKGPYRRPDAQWEPEIVAHSGATEIVAHSGGTEIVARP